VTEPEPQETVKKDEGKVQKEKEKEKPKIEEPSSKLHARKPSVSQDSRIRSTSFRASMGNNQGPTSPALKSPTLTSPTTEAADIYRKQAFKIEELEKENKKLEAELLKLQNVEEELDELREANSDVSLLRERAEEADKLKSEVASLKRQNAQLQASAKSTRRESTASPEADLKANLESKSATIEALELEISALNARVVSSQNSVSEHTARISDLESQLAKSKASSDSATQELEDLRTNLAREDSTSSTDSAALTRKLAQIEAELGSARRAAQDANGRAENLEKKISALTTLHREAETRHNSKLADASRHEREAKELRARVNALRTENARLRDEAARHKRLDADADESALEELEDEERIRLQGRVRELEEENFDLRRGIWRDQRKSMQPGLDDSAVFDDVDLSPTASRETPTRPLQQHSSIADVINSGISAFTSTTNGPSKPRKQSLGLLDDDGMEFDEESFRKAAAEEAAARIERVKEIKRGLQRWVGWRVDIADLRAGMGGVFDV
jgi:chromosome segregation ATPase